MKNLEFEIVVLGGGCLGSSIFFELMRQGPSSVALIDHGRKINSSTAKSGGMLRVFHENISHAELALEHFERENELRREKIFKEKSEKNGSLYFFNEKRLETFSNILQHLEKRKYPFELLSSNIGEKRFPAFRWNSSDCAVFEPEASSANPLMFCEDLLGYARKKGGSLFEDTTVQKICPFRGAYRISTNIGTFVCKSLILAGGAKMLPLIENFGFNFALSEKVLSVYRVTRENKSIILPNYFDRESLAFGRFGNKHDFILSNKVQDRLNLVLWESLFQEVSAVDSYAPGRKGLLGRIPGHPGLFLATGWGGTAFKFSLAVGHRLSKIVESEHLKRGRSYVSFHL